MEGIFRRYPIGIQSFEDLRNNNCVYIDKTELIYRLTNSAKTCFLSRPRRFGKSLLVSTLEAYFSGKKDLFKGLMMEQLEKDWTVYPVLHIDFSISKYMNAGMLRSAINNLAQKTIFNSLIQKYNVDLVLQGHEHAYARMTLHDEQGSATPPFWSETERGWFPLVLQMSLFNEIKRER